MAVMVCVEGGGGRGEDLDVELSGTSHMDSENADNLDKCADFEGKSIPNLA